MGVPLEWVSELICSLHNQDVFASRGRGTWTSSCEVGIILIFSKVVRNEIWKLVGCFACLFLFLIGEKKAISYFDWACIALQFQTFFQNLNERWREKSVHRFPLPFTHCKKIFFNIWFVNIWFVLFHFLQCRFSNSPQYFLCLYAHFSSCYFGPQFHEPKNRVRL